MKKHDFREMSDQECIVPGCSRKIKKNVQERKSEGQPLTCRPCFIRKERLQRGDSRYGDGVKGKREASVQARV